MAFWSAEYLKNPYSEDFEVVTLHEQHDFKDCALRSAEN